MSDHATFDDLPLSGVRVLDMSQFLAGPACALRLADLGASVTKIERVGSGDPCRRLAPADQWLGEDSLLFHLINRNKKSLAADLKDPGDLEAVRAVVAEADVVLHNFRPGVMERLGLGYQDVRRLNPKIIYGVVSGYGAEGPWRNLPGQDLLEQARSGMAWLSGSAGQGPVPMGVSIADMAAGMHLAQGILAALFRLARRGEGALVQVSLLASSMDLQFEQFTSYLNGPREQPARSAVNGANVHATAPYGIYETADGHMALAMALIARLRDLLSIQALSAFDDPGLAYERRDEIKQILQDHFRGAPTAHWLSLLEPAGIWCAEVLDWPALEATGVLASLGVVQEVEGRDGREMLTTTCPIRLDGRVLANPAGAPVLDSDGPLRSVASRKCEGAAG